MKKEETHKNPGSNKYIIDPYLLYNGNCEEAFNFYKSVFGGEFTGLMRYSDMPEGTKVAEGDKNKVVHVALPVGREVILMGGDADEGNAVKIGNNFALMLALEDKDEAIRLYDKLSAGGKVIMKLEKTFWAELYGMFTDKFGITWMINHGLEKK